MREWHTTVEGTGTPPRSRTWLRRLGVLRGLLLVGLSLSLCCLAAANADAAVVTLVPTADRAGSNSPWAPTGCASHYQCVDEAIPGSVNDADYIEIPTGGLAAIGHNGFDLTDPSHAVVGAATKLTVNVRVQRQTAGASACNISFIRLRTGSTTHVTSGNVSYPPGGTTAVLSFSTTDPVPWTASDIDGLYVEFNMDRCTDGWVRVYSVSVDVEYDPVPDATLLPNAEVAFTFPDWRTNGTGGEPCTIPNTWQCIDEAIPDDVVSTNSNIQAQSANYVQYGLTTATTGVVGRVGVRMVADAATGTRPLTYELRRSGTVLTTATPTLTTATLSYVTFANRYLSQADVDGLEVRMTSPDGFDKYVRAVSVDVWKATITGAVGNPSICDGTTPVVGVAVNSTKVDAVPCTAGSGNFASIATWAAGDIVTLYYDGVSRKAAAYARTTSASSSATPLSGFNLWDGEVHVRSLSGTPITAADIDSFDGDNDADIPVAFPVSGKLQVSASTGLVVNAGTFTPGVTVNTPRFWLQSSGTYVAGTTRMEVTASGTGACTNGTSGRPFCVVAGGTFTPGTGTVSYQGSSAYDVSNGTYAGLEITSSASNTVQLGTSAGGTVTASTLLVTGSGGAPVVSTSTWNPVVTVNGDVTVNGTATLGGAGSGTLKVYGDLTGTGLVNFTNGRVTMTKVAGGASTINAGGTLPGTPWQFAELWTFNDDNATTNTVTIPGTSREIRASTVLHVHVYSILDASAMTQPLTVTGDFETTIGTSWKAPPLMEVGGKVDSVGGYTPGTGTIRLTGSNTVTFFLLGTMHRFELVGASKTVQLRWPIAVSNSMVINGGSCSTPASLQSDTLSTSRQVDHPSAPVTATYATFRDINFTNGVVAPTDGGDLGGNSNIDFSVAPTCPAPTTPYVDSANASAGSTRPTSIDGRVGFHMSVVNALAATADRYRTSVSTSVLDSTVRGLWPLDGNGADRSSTNNTTVGAGGVGYTAGATDFGQAATFDGVNDQFAAPTNAAYNTSSYTVDLWFKASTTPTTWPTMVSRGGSGQAHFLIGFNTPNKTLVADLTTGNGLFEIATPSAPWLDNAWHHVALTVNSAKQMRLYVDGTQYGSTVTYTGTLHMPAAPIYIGGSQSFGSNYFAGQIDDVQFTAGEPDPAALAGYSATKRPHAQAVWQSTGYASTAGAALGSTCATGVRCVDSVYAGPDIRKHGARYYVTHQLRAMTTNLWSAATTDWFETSDGISITAAGSVAIPSGAPGADLTATLGVTTGCTNGSGCALTMVNISDTVGLVTSSGSASIPLYATGAPTVWAAGVGSGLGFTVLDSTSGKDTTTWGTGTTFASLAALKFTGVGRTQTVLQQTSGVGSETTTIGLRLNAPSAQTVGAYSGAIQLTAYDAP